MPLGIISGQSARCLPAGSGIARAKRGGGKMWQNQREGEGEEAAAGGNEKADDGTRLQRSNQT